MHTPASREQARQLDSRDLLARFRKRFYRPAGQIYLGGNSLGLLSRDAEHALLRVLNEWKTRAIGGWLEGESPWFSMPAALAARIAKLVGAQPDEVTIANATTVNLHQLLATLYRSQFARPRALIDALNFPSDRYALRSHLRLRGLDPDANLSVVEANGAGLLEESRIEEALADPSVQLAVLPTVVHTSGQLLDASRLCRAARSHGVVIGLDLSHSIGVLPHALDEWDADFAFWEHYKYINAGPGAIGGLYLNRRHFGSDGAVEAGLAGWWSGRKEQMLDMLDEFTPGFGAAGLQIGPPVLSMAPLEGALRAVEEAGLNRIRTKSLALTEFLREAIELELPNAGFTFATPLEPERRGGHLALLHGAARGICQALRRSGVVPDFRPPDLIRLAPAPLYTSFTECWDAVQILKRIMSYRSYEQAPTVRELVT
jgi:kynureninase